MSTKPRSASKDEPLDADTEERIRQRAYQLYEERGHEEGHDVEDWLQAEAEVVSRSRSAAA